MSVDVRVEASDDFVDSHSHGDGHEDRSVLKVSSVAPKYVGVNII